MVPSVLPGTEEKPHTVGNRKYRLCCFQVIGSLLPASAMPQITFQYFYQQSSSKSPKKAFSIKSFHISIKKLVSISIQQQFSSLSSGGAHSKSWVKLEKNYGKVELNPGILYNHEYHDFVGKKLLEMWILPSHNLHRYQVSAVYSREKQSQITFQYFPNQENWKQ